MATLLSPFERAGHIAEKQCRVALAGFGTVGSSVARLLQGRGDPAVQLTHIYNRGVSNKRADWVAPGVAWTERFDDVLSSEVDVVLELMGGLEPAHQLVRRALESRKSVVTANKQLMAKYGTELLTLARDNDQFLGFGACVAGGIPVLSALQDGLAGDTLTQIHGILNGTCNYILTRMESAGLAFGDALAEAQSAGFAEADPTEDVDGLDAGAKLALLARVAFNIDLSPNQIACRSIRGIDAVDFAYAHELNSTIRQISTARLHDGCVYASVGPALVPNQSPLAKVSGGQNLVVTTGEFGGDTSFGGNGAGGDPTAVAVVSDLVQAARHRWNGGVAIQQRVPAPCEVTEDVVAPHYLRFVVRDRPGILAALTGVLARHDINVDAVLQKANYAKSALPFVITLEPCRERDLRAAMAEIAGFDFLLQPPLSMPVIGME